MAADAEFAQNLCTGARAIAKAKGLQTVYDQNYPPNSVDFSSIIRAVRAAKPDIVFICSYPAESAAIVRAVNEIGVGPTVKMIGGGMVGLQFAPIMEALGPLLNGFVNYNSWVPEKTMANPAVQRIPQALLGARQGRRRSIRSASTCRRSTTPSARCSSRRSTATKSLDHKVLADYMHKNEMKTMVGNIRYDAVGEWATPRVPMAQFRGIKDKDLEQFRQAGKQVIIAAGGAEDGRHRRAVRQGAELGSGRSSFSSRRSSPGSCSAASTPR